MKVPKEKIPLVYKILDKADKMESSEYEKYILENFQDETIIQGIYKLKDAQNLKDLINKFEDIPEEFYNSKGYLELNNFMKLLEESEISEYAIFSPSVVRGLDYYTGIVYEVFDTGEENRRSIFGGGRYDDLLSLFSEERITGTGFGLGILMLSLFLKTYNLIPEEIRKMDYSDTIYIASINKEVASYALKLSKIIRDEDFPCIVDYRFTSVKNQLARANEMGVLITLIIGPNEMEENKVTIKNMISEKQKTLNLGDLLEEIYNIIDEYGND